ncbi:MAG: 3-methyladenine DNA glycosylase [Gammaproteobacteria bacterium]|nr:MAG: 3-methyladenine DNA glycosylase [Gammaproteobacteria bacterium]
MHTFATIRARAEKHKGGPAKLKKLLKPVLSKKKLAQKSDDRFLAMMARAINQAGFNWTVIANKWPQFEEAFFGFDVAKLGCMPPERWEAYVKDIRVVRHWPKIKAVMENTYFIQDTARQHDSFARFIADWPESDQVGLMIHLKKHGSRLGGNTGQWFLRYVGKDSFVLSQDVVTAIQDAGVDVADAPTSKRDLTKIQNAFNEWHEETGLPYTHLSRIAGFSVGTNYESTKIQSEMAKFVTD